MRKLWIVFMVAAALMVTLNLTSPKSAHMNESVSGAESIAADEGPTAVADAKSAVSDGLAPDEATDDLATLTELPADMPFPQPIGPDDYPFTLVAEQYPHIAARRHDQPLLTVFPDGQMLSFSVEPDPYPYDRLLQGDPVYFDLVIFLIEDGHVTKAMLAEYPQPSPQEAVFTDIDSGEVITWSFAQLLQQTQP